MRIVVNHLTGMRKDHICVAGLDVDTGQQVRPVLPSALTRAMLKRNGGLFDVGEVVDLGPVTPAGKAPEIEDRRFDLSKARSMGTMPSPEFWDLLKGTARQSLEDIFGPELERLKRTYATPSGKGTASLGCLMIPAEYVPRLVVSYDKLRLTLPAEDAMVAVTDLRCFEADGTTRRQAIMARFNDGMRAGRQLILAVGLGRPFRIPGDTLDRHWLQINNVYPAGLNLTEAACD